MKRLFVTLWLIFFSCLVKAQKTWDGGGDGFSWNNAMNWLPNGVPIATDNILLDNSTVLINYTVILPTTAVTTSVNSLTITPVAGIVIQLTIPTGNTANPGLNVTGPGDALVLNDRAILMNSTMVGAGAAGLAITNTFRINNGGKYVHNNVWAHATVVSQLSTAVGTETGVFEFDVPGAVGYTVSLSNRNFGTLIFSAVAAGSKTYSGNGIMDLTVRGDLIINSNATLNSSMNANINIAGNLTLTGNFDNSPTTAGTGRSIIFNGTSNQVISGLGSFTFNANFRNIEVSPAATVTLQRGINLSNAGNTIIINASGTLQMAANVVSGIGSFQLLTGGLLGIGHPDGITNAPTLFGNVQTTTRAFPSAAVYEYNGAVGVTQVTGDGLPASISGILKINTQAGLGTTGVTLTQTTLVLTELILMEGKLTTGMSNILSIGSGAITTAAYTDISFVNGIMRRTGNNGYRFPVGKGVTIHPAHLSMMGGPLDVCNVEYFQTGPPCSPGNLPGSIHHTSGLEYWFIQSQSMPPTNQITLYASTLSQATDRSRLVVARCNAGSWQNMGNANTGIMGAVGDVTSSVSLAGAFANIFTLASLDASPINPLPITLISFDASKLSNTKSSINWKLSACCSPAAKFEIQRADANKYFMTIGETAGSAINTLYNYADNDLRNGINYYRLKMTDADGTVSFSRTVAIMNGVDGLLLTSLIPTVITHSATLTVASSRHQKMDIIIVDMQGRIVVKRNFTINEGNTNLELQLTGLAAGIYQLTGLSPEGKTNTIRFIK